MAEVLPFQAVLFRPGAPELGNWTTSALEPLSPLTDRAPTYTLVAGDTAPQGSSASAPSPLLEADGSASSSSAEDGQLFSDEVPGFFAYRQEFRTENGLDKSRLGLVALLDPEGDPSGLVYTLAETEPHGVEHATRELARSTLQTTPLVGAVEDLSFELEKLLDRGIQLRDQPDLTLELDSGDRHRLWKIEDAGLLEALRTFFRGKPCYLVDGLHAQRALRRFAPAAPVPPLACLFNLFDFGVSLASAAVLVRDLPDLRINDLALRLNPFFEVKTYPFATPQALPRALTDFREDLRIRGFTESVVGACFRGVDHFFLFCLREQVERSQIYLPDVKPPLYEQDAVLLRRVILERYLGVPAGPGELEYAWTIEDAVAGVRSGKLAAAFFINPPNKRKLLQLSRTGLRLPPGTIRLDPPLRARLIMAPARKPR